MKISKVIAALLLGGATAGVMGCGSASNDQGVSFALLGFTSVNSTGGTGFTCATTDFDNIVVVPIGESSESPTSGIITAKCVRLQNNLTAQTVRAERAQVSYFVPGADEQPPSTTVPVTVTLGAAAGDTTTAPGAGTGLANTASSPIDMVPPEIRSWLTLNRGSLPEAPFSMDLVIKVYGITSAGDQLVTNEAYYQAQVTNDIVINPDTGGGDGTTETVEEGTLTEGDLPIDDGTGTGGEGTGEAGAAG